MRVHVVSDVHGAAAHLARAAEGSDVFVCLGDLILFLDYHDPSRGMFADLFGAEYTAEYIALRTANRFEEARELSARAWSRLGVDGQEGRWGVMQAMVRSQYEELFDAMPRPAFLTYGNVDVPDLWPDYLDREHQVLDGEVVDIDGLRWGFVGGGLPSPMRTPFEVPIEVHAEKVAALGPVDILFTHIPPAIPELTYDVEARRFEIGSPVLLEYVREHQPRFHLFGHSHQPLVARTRIGRTECINVGHFQGGGQPFVLDLP